MPGDLRWILLVCRRWGTRGGFVLDEPENEHWHGQVHILETLPKAQQTRQCHHLTICFFVSDLTNSEMVAATPCERVQNVWPPGKTPECDKSFMFRWISPALYIKNDPSLISLTAFQLAPKWSKVAISEFCKFGSFQPYLSHRQLDWSTMTFIESPLIWYPTCLIFGHLFWWSTTLCTARTTWRRRLERKLTWGYITSVDVFYRMLYAVMMFVAMRDFKCFQHVWPH